MSFWTKIRRPIVGLLTGGPLGGVVGLGIDSSKGQGLFERQGFQLDASGRPLPPEYQPTYDPTNTAAGAMKLALDGDPALQGIAAEGTRTGKSRWANLSQQEQERQATMARDQAARQAGAAGAAARTQLAARGGLSTGAAERIATNTANDVMALNQGISAEQLGNNAQIAINDEQNRLNALQVAGNMSMSKSNLMNNANQFDISNQQRDKEQRNAFDLDRYNEAMRAWGANQNAQAVQQGGKK